MSSAEARLRAGDEPRAIAAAAIESAPLARRDPMLACVFSLLSALAHERGDLRRAARAAGLTISGRPGSRVALVASIAASLDARADQLGRTDVGELAIRAALEVLLDAPLDAPLLRPFLARVLERWLLHVLGHAPVDYLPSIAEHVRFRAAIGELAREAAAAIPLTGELAPALDALERALREVPS